MQFYDVNGVKVYLDHRESPMMNERVKGNYRTNFINYIKNNLKKSNVFVDIGATTGYFGLLAAKTCEKVYFVEPHPDNIANLKKSIEENNFKNCEIIEAAALDFNGDTTLYIGAKSGWHSVVKKSEETLKIKAVRLDSLIKEKNLIVKISAQGSNLTALKGLEDVVNNINVILTDNSVADEIDRLLSGFTRTTGRDIVYHRDNTPISLEKIELKDHKIKTAPKKLKKYYNNEKLYYIFGLQRTGTNFLESIIKRNFDLRKKNANKGLWKHSVSVHSGMTNGPIVILRKHPYTWIESIAFRNNVDWEKTQKRFPALESSNNPNNIIGPRNYNLENLAKTYHAFYRNWILDLPDEYRQNAFIINYEDMLNEKKRNAILLEFANRFNIEKPRNWIIPNAGTVSQSKDYTKDMEKYYVSNKPKHLKQKHLEIIDGIITKDFIESLDKLTTIPIL